MLTHSFKSLVSLSVVLGAVSFAVPASAAGDDNNSRNPTVTCSNGKVFDRKTKKCVRPKKSSQLDDDNIYDAARDLAYHGRYGEAINVLKLANNPNDPRILNYLGYSNRKLGRIQLGLTYYKAALKEDPDYTLVMEYMGEAFLQLGQVAEARAQLAEIKKRCGKGCREYTMLQTEIDKYLAQ